MSLVEVKVPDIGDFKDVDVIEVNIKPGDVIENEQALMTLESDKASIEVPSDTAGTVKEVRVKAGDKVSQGTLIALVETSADAAPAKDAPKAPAKEAEKAPAQAEAKPQQAAQAAAPAPAPAKAAAAAPQAGSYSGSADIECDMLVLGSGPGGYSAAFRSADLGMKTVLVERYATLGGVCLNVGCIPSKALLHTALVIDEAEALGAHGITFAKPQIDLDKLREFKSGVVKKLTGGLAGMAKMRKVEVVTGNGAFVDPHHMEVQTEGGKKVVKFKQAIIAAGSEAVKLPFIPEDPRVVDSTGALELRQIPQRMLVIGGGIIGLEMATVYATLGAKIDVVEMLDGLMAGADRDLVKVWEKYNSKRFANVMLKTKTTAAEAKDDGIHVSFEGEKAPAEAQRYDLVLVAVGRTPNGKKIGADKAGVAVTDRGFIDVDRQMRTNVPHIFAIGDIVGQPMLAHKAVHEGHVAAEAAHGEKAYFDALQIPSVAYTDPEVAWAGKTEDQLKAAGIKYGKAVFPWAASGRAIANGRDEGFTKLLFDEETHRVIGGGIVGLNAGDLISEVCLAIEMGADATDIGKTIHPHPTLGESIGMAAELYEGVCTDLPPQKKK
ncbi:dihydrolipoamide dehydrogenase [Burkholderia sp. Ch1-1]|uniref:Dihydrolipoyl dehydrogenase n=1 Tax=Paraburkholderia dioscoreae TaxID=2604047 RepID=A0A5Q4ZER4_9BURK|nr:MULTISPECIES: dihydrolipoyl dehydrogenase [Paraburkholderia]EIF30560.1 dihydrolipoamide dehydrogenase [Burkholderia sp. Ch1-1]MDR8395017.1 dihydrolipoyl dehydrogenase [Paraburkholderia sp. USG1]VVD29332.1 Dihydrolipoyl dehydrogenase [Paraburkholderia dioscoreae]